MTSDSDILLKLLKRNIRTICTGVFWIYTVYDNCYYCYYSRSQLKVIILIINNIIILIIIKCKSVTYVNG